MARSHVGIDNAAVYICVISLNFDSGTVVNLDRWQKGVFYER